MEGHGYLQSFLIFLVAVVIAVPVARRLKLGSVLGYLAAGVVIGPFGLKLVRNPEAISSISEFGVALLLFVIGLELSPQRLWVMRRAVFGAGLAQVAGCAAVLGAVAYFAFSATPAKACVIGLGLALSSTAFGLQTMAERKELQTGYGRLAFAVLLFQDLAAIPLIAAIPLLDGGALHAHGGQPLWISALRVVGVIALVVVGGRYALRPVFRAVAKTQLIEVSTATALLVVMGTAWLMLSAGVSMALGTFLAGVLLADSEYRHELESNIAPFEGLLLGLFFIAVGMGVDLGLLLLHPWLVCGLVAMLLICKAPVLLAIGRVFRLDFSGSLRLAVLLAGGGEFAFVVFNLAEQHGLLDADRHRLLVLVITLSMAMVPLLVLGVAQLPNARKPRREFDTIDNGTPRVIIAGFGRVGQIVARLLRAHRIPFTALESSVEQVDLSRRFGGTEIYFGDPSRAELLRAAQADKAEVFVLATDDPETNVRTARIVRRLFPHLKIIARARNRQHAFRLMDLTNPDGVVRETFYSSLKMAGLTLEALGFSHEAAQARVNVFREHDERLLRDQHLVYDDEAALMQSSKEAFQDLERLFEADIEREDAAELNPPPAPTAATPD
ncbi:MAG TPA: monovalent cation:proton antiporter-2 (CPA2) family protein [Rhodanobacteraceae bacterium]|nr:monovalent cation:proton antiporter-2 (CPA2) family protein [Rhodanobacteraceae bacterium]